MRGAGWVIQPRMSLALLGALVGYAFAAEAVGFDLVTVRVPPTSPLAHRLAECQFLYFVACLAIGWTCYLLKRRPLAGARWWPVVLIPLAPALLRVVPAAMEAYEKQLSYLSDYGWDSFTRQKLMMSSFLAAGPLLSWFFLSVVVAVSATVWRRKPPNVCESCAYDITGNESGTCPECGQEIQRDGPQSQDSESPSDGP
jgi:predicted RNA-binding Zn-ribbon protein involved in translation (DUF1610 family)